MSGFLPAGTARFALEMQHDSTSEGAIVTGAFIPVGDAWEQADNDLLYDAMANTMAQAHSTDVLYKSLVVDYHTFGTDQLIQRVTFGVVTGVRVAGSIVPQNCAYLIQKHSAQIGRSQRGRMYVPYVDSSDLLDVQGNLNEQGITVVDDLATAWEGLFNAPTLRTQTGVILHSNPAAPATAITHFVAVHHIGTQRRRINRRS